MSEIGSIKSACQACDGRMELPQEALGVQFACPHCNTMLELALKCACNHCGGPLSFPMEGIGHRITCGHCSSDTLLMPSAIRAKVSAPAATAETQPQESAPAAVTQPIKSQAPSRSPAPASNPSASLRTPGQRIPGSSTEIPKAVFGPKNTKEESFASKLKSSVKSKFGSSKSTSKADDEEESEPDDKKKLIAIGVIGILVLGFAGWQLYDFFVPKKRAKRPTIKVVQPAKAKSLKVLEAKVQADPDSGVVYVVGKVHNTSKNPVAEVDIRFNVKDAEGKLICDASDYIATIDADAQWDFRALVSADVKVEDLANLKAELIAITIDKK